MAKKTAANANAAYSAPDLAEGVSPELLNSLTQFAAGVSRGGAGGNLAQLSKSATMYHNLRFNLISNDRNLLSFTYVEHGIVQTLVDQPVDDAFSTGFEILSSDLAPEDIRELEQALEEQGAIDMVIQGLKWKRLYGGGAVIINTEQDPAMPLDINKITDNMRLRFIAADMWELTTSMAPSQQNESVADLNNEFFYYYGKKIHRSRVLLMVGKVAPSFVRPRLRGWGMSVLERLVRSINAYMKNQDVVFELLDEAKVDVYKIQGFNTSMASKNGTQDMTNRVQLANMVKSYINALTMDKNDDYEQKQMAFTGLGDMLVQIRQGVAADLRMPMTKLFGISAAGFNSGEDDIENYNSMIESEIRRSCRGAVISIVKIMCQRLFGYIPADITIKFNPLRQLSAKDEEEVKNFQFNRTMASWEAGLITTQEFKQAVNKKGLLPIPIDEDAEALPSPVEGTYTVEAPAAGGDDTGKK